MALIIENRQNKYDDKAIQKLIESVIESCLEYEDIKRGCEVSVTLVDNLEIQKINREYRNIDRPTDVLSFPMFEREEIKNLEDGNVTDMDLDTWEIVLGDIVLSIEKAHEQSMEYGHSFEREVAFLTVHGMLHLLGYDHEEEADRVIMRKREEEILNKLKLFR